MAQQDMQNLIQNWMGQQQELWQEWVRSVQQGAGGGAAQPWAQGFGHWQEAVERTLETQKQAIRIWADHVAGVEGAPEEMKRWAEQGVKLVDQWTDAQNNMWQQWFELMRGSGSGGGEDREKLLRSGWEQMAAQMQELQRQWAGWFSGMAAPAKSKGGGKPGRSKAT